MLTHDLTEVLVRPEPFLKKISRKPDRLGAFKVPIILGLLGLISGMIISSKINLSFVGTGALPDMSSAFNLLQIIVLIVLPSVSPIITFFVNAGIIHLFSVHLFGAKGNFERTSVMVGYSYAPRLITGILLVLVALLSQPVSGNVNISDLDLASQQTVLIILSFFQQTPLLLISYLDMAFLLWSAYLMALSSRIEYRHEWLVAAIVVAIPTLIIFLI